MDKQTIKKHLRQKGYRLTQQLHQVLAALTDSPQNVTEIVKNLIKKRALIDKATIYRILDRLVGLKIVNKTHFQDKIAMYELSSQPHHHHLVCDSCGRVENITFEEDLLINAVRPPTNFQIRSHYLEFFGYCNQCQKKSL